MNEVITLAHGSGGKVTHRLIEEVFYRNFANDDLCKADDAAQLQFEAGRLAFTTDSFVITPRFFRGGDIGKLSVCGTVNDLTTSGAKPAVLSCGFIIEEGFSFEELQRIVASMASTARECGVRIVTGDTKVVQKGAADGLFINTSGIGTIPDSRNISSSYARVGDAIIVTGSMGDHGCAIMLEREQLNISSSISSDCAPLNGLLEKVYQIEPEIHVLRDPTRGGLATSLREISAQSGVGMLLNEEKIPIKREVQGVCEILGLDPLYMANEGKMIIILPAAQAESVLQVLREHPLGQDAQCIGEVTANPEQRVVLKTTAGGLRIIEMLTGDQLPRIC